MDKFKNKYRIQSHRKPSWDYSADALYFLTIVTQNRECNLGEIVHTDERPIMILSNFGKIVEIEWFKSFEIRDELILHEFILMPYHLHAIVEIDNKNRDTTRRDARPCVSTFEPSEIPEPSPSNNESNNGVLQIKRNPPIRLPKSISSFMAGFKSAVNTQIDDYIDEHKLSIPKYNRNNHFFQPNYHDHIIRNNFEYKNIQTYIENNPMNWEKDTFHI